MNTTEAASRALARMQAVEAWMRANAAEIAHDTGGFEIHFRGPIIKIHGRKVWEIDLRHHA